LGHRYSYTNFELGKIIGGKDALEVDTIANKLLDTDFHGAIKDLPETYKSIFGGNDKVN